MVFSRNVEGAQKEQILAELPMKEVDQYAIYLGLPTIIGRSKKMVSTAIKERNWKKLQGFEEKLLSKPGKEILIKSVAQAISTYAMSIFCLPDTLLDEIHGMMAKSWWGLTDQTKKIH